MKEKYKLYKKNNRWFCCKDYWVISGNSPVSAYENYLKYKKPYSIDLEVRYY